MPDPALGLVKIRVIAADEEVERMADLVGGMLEQQGYEVIEFSKKYTLQPPEQFRSRIFVAAIPKERGEK